LPVVHTVGKEGLGAIIRMVSARRATPGERRLMKKSNEKRVRTITKTIEQIENREITKAERARLKRVSALPDERIDTSDIPEVKGRGRMGEGA
jgi:hypothetical protein